MSAVPSSGAVLSLRRLYPVAPAAVWRAWTDPAALARWFGPGAADTARCIELDLRVGGRWRIAFGAPDDSRHEAWGEYLEVVPHERLAFTWHRHGMPEAASQVRLVFRAVAEGTELAFEHADFRSAALRDDHRQGWEPTLDKLGALLRGELA